MRKQENKAKVTSIDAWKKIGTRKVGFFHVMYATFIKELIMKTRYKMNFVMFWLRSLIFIGIFALFAYTLTFKGSSFSFEQTLIFFLVGFYIIMYDSTALWSPYEMVTNDIYNGTLEYVYSTPSSKAGYFVGAVLSEAFVTSIITTPILGFLIYYARLGVWQIGAIVMIMVGFLLILTSFGVMFGLLVVVFKQAGPLANIIGSAFTFFSGFLFPIQALPSWVQWVSYGFPYTWAMDVVRKIILQEYWNPLFPIYIEIVIMLIQLLLFWSLALILLGKVEARVKREGLHLI